MNAYFNPGDDLFPDHLPGGDIIAPLFIDFIVCRLNFLNNGNGNRQKRRPVRSLQTRQMHRICACFKQKSPSMIVGIHRLASIAKREFTR